MLYKRLLFPALVFAVLTSALQAQEDDTQPMSCLNAQEILFPLEQNDFSKSEILMNENTLNALYYLYEDRYTFWYKFIATEDITIDYSVSPTNEKDRYRSIVFQYGGNDFCDKLVNENLQPIRVQRNAIIDEKGEILYRNTIDALKGDTFYVSVLSLRAEDCGHYLYMESREESFSFHAIHRPCYDFARLFQPDFSTQKEEESDVSLNLTFSKKDSAESEQPVEEEPLPALGFSALETIEIESEGDDFISVGDRLILNQVFFYSNTYAFKPGATAELDQLVNFLESNPTVEVEIQGHTANDTEDIRPDPNFKGQGKEWNFKGSAVKLSERRAEAVMDYLIEKGISKKRLIAEGYGDTQKRIPDAKTFDEFEKNMRVEAVVTKQ